MTARWFNILAAAVVLLGIGLRVPGLSSRSLWFDEALAANNSSGTVRETIVNTRTDNSCPILQPLVLFAVERVSRSAIALRAASFTSSVLLLVLVVVMGLRILGAPSALFAALLLALTPSQIHYAQEVREYALSSLMAGLLTLSYLDLLEHPDGHIQRLRLCSLLALAPLVQYGLVLFGVAILVALAWTALGNHPVPWRYVVLSTVALSSVGLFSLLFTLRYQLGADVFYLEDSLFRFGKTNPLKFLYHNTLDLMTFLTPGWVALGLVMLGLATGLILPSRAVTDRIRKLVICAMGVALAGAVAHLYPLGGVRQCLYLAPLLCITASLGLQETLLPLGQEAKLSRFAIAVSIAIVSAISAINTLKPYAEEENTKSVLALLSQLATPGDDVYVYYGARPAAECYAPRFGIPVLQDQVGKDKWEFQVAENKGKRFIFGGVHRNKPEQYLSEILSASQPETNRLWLVFSHIFRQEDQRIIHDLRAANPGCKIVDCLRSTDALLFEECR